MGHAVKLKEVFYMLGLKPSRRTFGYETLGVTVEGYRAVGRVV